VVVAEAVATVGPPRTASASVVTFADRASHDGWHSQPDHRVAQRRGREAFYTSYSVQVADVTDVSAFPDTVSRACQTDDVVEDRMCGVSRCEAWS